jgi:hypothetical protein
MGMGVGMRMKNANGHRNGNEILTIFVFFFPLECPKSYEYMYPLSAMATYKFSLTGPTVGTHNIISAFVSLSLSVICNYAK